MLSHLKQTKFTVLASLSFLLSVGSFAQTLGAPPPSDTCQSQFVKLDPNKRITLKNDAIENNSFTVSRDLNQYGAAFSFDRGHGFFKNFNNLPPEAVWVDMGAGDGLALNEGLNEFPQIGKGVAISYKKTNSAVANRPDNRLEYLDGDFVENMWSAGRLDHLKGKVDLITDVHGPLAYSSDLKNLIEVYSDLLKPGGKLYFVMMNKRNFTPGVDAAGDPKSVNTFRAGDKEVELLDWLKKIPGLKVEATKTQNSRAGELYEEYLSFKIEKSDPKVVVPENLRTVSYFPSTPPRRIFVIDDNPTTLKTFRLDPVKGPITKEQIETIVKSASSSQPVNFEIVTHSKNAQKLVALKEKLKETQLYKNWISSGKAVKWQLSISDPSSADQLLKIIEEYEDMILEINWT